MEKKFIIFNINFLNFSILFSILYNEYYFPNLPDSLMKLSKIIDFRGVYNSCRCYKTFILIILNC